MNEALVGFFDIIGFKNLVEENSHEKLLEIYQESIYSSMDMFEKIYQPVYDIITPKTEVTVYVQS